MCGVLARTFLAPSDAVDGWIMFMMSQVLFAVATALTFAFLTTLDHKSLIHTMGIAFDKSQPTCFQLLGRDLSTTTKCESSLQARDSQKPAN